MPSPSRQKVHKVQKASKGQGFLQFLQFLNFMVRETADERAKGLDPPRAGVLRSTF